MDERPTILVVDDDPLNLALAARTLREEGYRVETAMTGEGALRLAQEHRPALVLLDVVLPDADGVALSGQIKEACEGTAPYVVLLSGIKTGPDDQAFGLERGADGYITRPVSKRELLARLEAILRLKRAEEGLAQRTRELEERTADLEAANARLAQEVAERKRVEAALRENEARLVQQERLAAVGQLTTGLAHGVNSVLQTILLRVEVTLADRSISPTVRQSLREIREQTGRVTSIVRKLLDFSGMAILTRQEVDLGDLVRKQVRGMRSRLPGEVALRLDAPDEPVYVRADAARLQQLMTNLIRNAVDAMPGGGEVTVALRRGPAEASCSICSQPIKGEWVQLSIEDTGAGIAPETAAHIFEPFFTTRAPERSGLGLSQVLGIAKQHEGHLQVESEGGRGTSVTVFLPPFPGPEN